MNQPAGYVSIFRGGTLLQRRPLRNNTATIGRLPDNWLVLPDVAVARCQAELDPLPSAVLLTNLDAAPIVLDGHPLLAFQPARLADQARLSIGPFELVYHAEQLPADKASYAPIATEARKLGAPQPEPAREANLPVLPDGPSRYLYELPPIYQEADGFLGRYLKLFEAVWEPFEHRQDQIAMYFDPRTCPPALLGWLASWLGVAADPQLLEGPRGRRFVAEALDLYRWRGTRYGLTRAIEIALGQTPRIEDAPDAYTVLVRMPAPPAEPAERELLRRLLRAACPAHVAWQIKGEGWEP